MTPEVADYLAIARQDLQEADTIAAVSLSRLAARSAYSAAFHAAEAFIFARTGKVVKTHSGVQSEFSRLLRTEAPSELHLGRVLSKGYGFKDLADYGTGKDRTVTVEDAAAMIVDARSFVARVTALLEAPPSAEG